MNPHESNHAPGLLTHPVVSSNINHGIPHFPTPRMHPLLSPETTQGHSIHPTHGAVSSSMGHGVPQLPTSRMTPQPQESSHLFSIPSTQHHQATVSSSLSHNIPQIQTPRLNPQEALHIPNLHSQLPTVSRSLSHSLPQLHVPTPRLNLQIQEVIQAPSLHNMPSVASTLEAVLGQNMERDEAKSSLPAQPTVATGSDTPTRSEKKLKKKKGKKKGEVGEKLTQKGKLRKMPTKITPEVLVIINRIISYFEVEKRIRQPCYAWRCVNSRVAKAVGISPRTVRKIRLRELNGPVPPRPRKKSTGRPPTLRESELKEIQNTIEAMDRAKEVIKVDTVKAKLDSMGLMIARTTLYNTLKKMGFRYTQKTGKKPKPAVIGWSRINQDDDSLHKANEGKRKTRAMGNSEKHSQSQVEYVAPLRMDAVTEEDAWLCVRDIETGEQQVQNRDGPDSLLHRDGKMVLSTEEVNFMRQIF